MISRTRAALLAAAILVLPGPANADTVVPTLNLSVDGTVMAVPDTAVVTFGVLTEAETAGDALTENNASMRALISEVKAAGIADKDVGTSGFSIDPVMVYPEYKNGRQEPPRITGYRVSNRVTVKIRDIATAGDILDRVVRVGANQVQGISFTVEDDAALLDAARAEAMRAATRKAALYAEAGDFTVGRILSISETRGAIPYAAMAPRMMAEAKSADSVPIAPGEQEMSVTVTVSWEIHETR